MTGFELSVLRLQNAISVSIMAMPKKSHFTIFVIQNFVQNRNKTHMNFIYIVVIMFVR